MSKSLSLLAAALLLSGSAMAQNLVVNGNFDQLTTAAGAAVTQSDNYIVNDATNRTGWGDLWGNNLTGWTNNGGAAIVFGAGLSDSIDHFAMHAPGYPDAYIRADQWGLYGPQNTDYVTTNGLTATSPQGGNFFGSDSNFWTGSLAQTVNGLVIGQTYTLSFYWAGAELKTGGSGLDLNTGWNVTLGSDVSTSVSGTYSPARRTDPTHNDGGFLDWSQASYTFTATANSQLLTFLPTGTGSPPMSLLDGVSIVAVPEPAQWALMVSGVLLLSGLRLRQRRKQG